MPKERRELSQIQRWMQTVIMHPGGVEAGIAAPAGRDEIDVSPDRVEDVIHRSRAQSGIERLQVYAHAHYARLLEVLAAEFPALAQALGEELFGEFAIGYLQKYPSQSYTLADLGQKFPQFLADSRPPRESDDQTPDWADCLADLARLERIYSEVFDGPGAEGQRVLRREDLDGIPADAWPTMRLITIPCLRLVRLRFPVHEFITAVRRGDNPPLPAPCITRLIVTRRDYVVRRVAVDEPEFAALAAIVAGETIAQSLKAAQQSWPGDDGQLAAAVRRWFRDWSAAGYFQAVDLS